MKTKKINAWIKAFRLRTLPLALAGIGMGGFLAAFESQFSWDVFLLSVLTALLLQVLSNLANDYGDYKNGADLSGRTGPVRAVQGGTIKEKEMKFGIFSFIFLSLISGILLLWTAFHQLFNYKIFIFFITGILAIVAAIKYTAGKNPYGYAGLGDLFVFIFFGIVAVTGSYYLHTNQFNKIILLPSVSVGFLATAVLNINNIRDINSDKLAGKYTLPVRLGLKYAKIYHIFLLTGAMVSILFFIIIASSFFWQSAVFISFPLLLVNVIKIYKADKSDVLDPLLKQMALSTLIFVLSFGIGGII